MKDRRLYIFWRRVYELPAALFWYLGAGVAALYGYYGDFGFRFLLLAAIPMAIIGTYRLLQANKLLSFKARLQSLPDFSLSLDELISICKKNPDKAYIGHGFVWTQKHTQLVYDLNARDESLIHPGNWYMMIRKLFGLTSKFNPNVKSYLHGIGNEESVAQFVNLEERYTHRALSGTTGSGKGRALTLDLVGAIVRHESGIFVDPKLDQIAVNVAYATMKKMGRENYFYYFNPAYPQSSIRLDLLSSYGTLSQIAARVVNIMPPSNDESFKNFSWRAINTIVHILSLMGVKITLKKIRECIQQDVSNLVQEAGVYYLSQFEETKEVAQRIKENPNPQKAAQLVQATYMSELKDSHPSKDMESLFGVYSQDQNHYQKLIQNIIPQLTQLTQGPLEGLLSPDPEADDPRPIVSLKTIVRTRGLLYLNLASLNDPAVGSSLGALLLNDSLNTVGDRYYYKHDILDDVPMNIWIDEASDVVSAVSTSMSNKSRGAKVAMTFSYQTINDLEDRLGSRAAAEKLLGNLNIKSQYRAEDEPTQVYMSGQMKETTIRTMDFMLMTNSVDGRVADFNTSYNKQLKHKEVPTISPMSLGDLPDLNMFTLHQSGRIVKLRVPYVATEESYVLPKYGPTQFGVLPSLESLTSSATGSFQFNDQIG